MWVKTRSLLRNLACNILRYSPISSGRDSFLYLNSSSKFKLNFCQFIQLLRHFRTFGKLGGGISAGDHSSYSTVYHIHNSRIRNSLKINDSHTQRNNTNTYRGFKISRLPYCRRYKEGQRKRERWKTSHRNVTLREDFLYYISGIVAAAVGQS